MPASARWARAVLFLALATLAFAFASAAFAASTRSASSPPERPYLPEPPLSTGSALFLGGGAGHAAGADAVFVNPGALSIAAGSEVELGVMGLSRGPSPYSLVGGRAGPWSYAAGSFYDQRIGPFRGGLVAGGAREVAPGASLGAAVRSQGGLQGFGVDADAGLLLRPRGPGFFGDWAVLGLAVRNLAESGLGQEPEGYQTPRSYALSAGARREAARVLLLPVLDPDVAYEFRAEGLRNAGLSHLFSAGAAFTPTGALSLRASLRLPHEGSAQAALGGSLRFALGTGGLRCGYTFTAGGVPGGGAPGTSGGQTHSLSATLTLGTRVDRLPPRVAVRADRVYLGADVPGHDRVHFRLRAADLSAARDWTVGGEDFAPPGLEGADGADGADGVEEAKAPGDADAGGRGELGGWSLDILATDREGRKSLAVRNFKGMDLPPRLIRWDGRGEDGAALAPGFYAFRLSAVDKAGNRSETAWQLVELGPGPLPSPEKSPERPAEDRLMQETGTGTGAAPDSGSAPPPILEGDDG